MYGVSGIPLLRKKNRHLFRMEVLPISNWTSIFCETLKILFQTHNNLVILNLSIRLKLRLFCDLASGNKFWCDNISLSLPFFLIIIFKTRYIDTILLFTVLLSCRSCKNETCVESYGWWKYYEIIDKWEVM